MFIRHVFIIFVFVIAFVSIAQAQVVNESGIMTRPDGATVTLSIDQLNNLELIDGVITRINNNEREVIAVIDEEIERLERLIDGFTPTVRTVWLAPPVTTFNNEQGDAGGDAGGGGGGGGGGDCFPAGSMVTLHNGDEMPIEYVQVGQKLKSPDGGIVTVTALDRPLLAERTLYRINGALLLSPEHPVQTDNGFKSINPEATARVNPDLPVAKLEVGDAIHTLNGLQTITYIEPFGRKSDLTLYNFALSGGNTYYVDGFAVHNNMPAADDINTAALTTKE